MRNTGWGMALGVALIVSGCDRATWAPCESSCDENWPVVPDAGDDPNYQKWAACMALCDMTRPKTQTEEECDGDEMTCEGEEG